MTGDDLAKKAAELGFQLFEPGATDPNKTLAAVLESHDMRFWEAFPAMLANAAEAGRFDYDAVRSCLKAVRDQKNFDRLFGLSLALFDVLKTEHKWSEKWKTRFVKDRFKEYFDKVNSNSAVTVGNAVLSSEKLKRNFLNYHVQSTQSLKHVLDVQDELGLEYALSQVFTVRQKELFLKKLRHEKMTKTEREYFSRVVKKKARALANEELHRLARKSLD